MAFIDSLSLLDDPWAIMSVFDSPSMRDGSLGGSSLFLMLRPCMVVAWANMYIFYTSSLSECRLTIMSLFDSPF